MEKNLFKKLAWLPFVLFGLALTLNGCKNHGPTVSYDYLIKKDTDGTTDSPPKDLKDEDKVSESSGLSSNATLRKVVKTAESYLGTPYKYGGINSKGVDCSGLTTLAYNSISVALPRSARDQSNFGKNVSKSRIKAGDIICFSAYNNGKIDHVGLVTKVKGAEITFIHATVSGGVRHDRLDIGYWSKRYMKSRRVY